MDEIDKVRAAAHYARELAKLKADAMRLEVRDADLRQFVRYAQRELELDRALALIGKPHDMQPIAMLRAANLRLLIGTTIQ